MEQHLDARVIDDYLVKKPFIRITPDYWGDTTVKVPPVYSPLCLMT